MSESNVVELKKPPLAERLAQNADGILEQIAREYSVSTFEVVRALPADHRTIVAGSLFEKIFAELTSWGEVLFIVHTPDIVLECAGKIPPGSFCRGYFNIHGDSPIGGHQGRELRAHRLRQPAVHGPAVAFAAVLQRRRRGHVQDFRAPRRQARAAARAGSALRCAARLTGRCRLIASLLTPRFQELATSARVVLAKQR
jgi:Haem utilisation ChuX/HutX